MFPFLSYYEEGGNKMTDEVFVDVKTFGHVPRIGKAWSYVRSFLAFGLFTLTSEVVETVHITTNTKGLLLLIYSPAYFTCCFADLCHSYSIKIKSQSRLAFIFLVARDNEHLFRNFLVLY